MFVGEISVHGYIGGSRAAPDGSEVTDERLRSLGYSAGNVSGAAVLRALADLTARGIRTVLVRINSCGGHVADASIIYNGLRAFSIAGGTVIAHIQRAASTAPLVALAADFIVMDPVADIHVHSTIGGSDDRVAKLNRALSELFAERTLTPLEEIERWVALKPGVAWAELDFAAAASHGWADAPGSADDAAALAQAVARGGRAALPMTGRRHVLLARQACAARRAVVPRAPLVMGAKLDHTGVAIKTGHGGLQIGRTRIINDWWAKTWWCGARLSRVNGSFSWEGSDEIQSVYLTDSEIVFQFRPPGVPRSLMLAAAPYIAPGAPIESSKAQLVRNANYLISGDYLVEAGFYLFDSSSGLGLNPQAGNTQFGFVVTGMTLGTPFSPTLLPP
jgi:ATP-dependent protease ClpP protease subunit